ncbi:intradiol ring-cleavage dioxygenase [Brucella suis bv. 4 str. 40]|nr:MULTISPECIES: protocatechuate 3,4-dioxygenase subunit alpha [Brucella]EEW89819.1 intradiol ring-cleavage dioxygenase [Brucella suis bv. 4 str. 40]
MRSPTRALISLEGTRSEITGPVFGHNMLNELDNDLILNYARPGEMPVGPRILVHGRVLDEGNRPVPGALLEFWQANAGGLYNSPSESRGKADPHFRGWGRCPSNMETGEFIFETIKPGRVPFRDGRLMAPHVTLWIVARGINLDLQTRMYFSDEEAANAEDPVLARIEHRMRVPTLIGQREGDVYHFDIHLQGEKETVFFDI